jgi:flagellar hook-associated protein 2
MAGIAATGIGSNLDVGGLVDKLMAVEQQPLTTLNKKEAAVTVKISAFATFRGALSSFQSTLVGLEQNSSYNAAKATVSDTSIATASASTGADPGVHSLEVTNLAVAERVKSGSFKALTDNVGTGTISIQYGSYDGDTSEFAVNDKRPTQTITIDAGHSSLAGVRDAINAAKIGVNASIVNDGGGFRLVLASKNSGTENGMRITVADGSDSDAFDASGLSQLAYDPAKTLGAGKNMAQVVAAEDATFMMDGLAITKASNTVSDVLTGTTFNLLKTNTGSPTTLSVAQDTAPVQGAVDGFVKAYNELNKTVTDLTKYNSATKTAGALQGDASIRSLAARIRDGLSALVSGASAGYGALAQVGITLDRSGNLSLDTAKLQTAMQNNPRAVMGLFATSGYTDDSLVNYTKSIATTPVGLYDLNVSQLATQGQAVGSAVAALTIDASNDSLTVAINGVTSSVTLGHATYASPAALAAELQTQLNGSKAFTDASISTKVSETSGVLTLMSTRYGSASKVSLTSGNAQAALFGATPTATDGLDVTGSLGGVPAVGNGQDLVHSNGLGVQVLGGALGSRGSIHFSRGIAVQLDDLIGQAIGTKGLLAGRTESLNASIKQIDGDRDRLNAQLLVKQARYTQQFNTLDQLISSTQSTMSYLQQQLSSLPKF